MEHHQRIAYIFQGGGALGAYQLGIFRALSEHGYEPHLIGGSSIGAINASIIVGNKPEDRLQKLNDFWNIISTQRILPEIAPQNESDRRWFNYLSAQQTLLIGQPGFFSPRIMNPMFATNSTPDELSFYILDPLQQTLEQLIDFDYLNSHKPRLVLQAVEVSTGKPVFFDNTKQKIDARHIMASGALPPGLPAVEIDGKYYWDGGVISHIPLESLMDKSKTGDILCFSANLFDSYGLLPQTLDDVMRRHKDITYSSRYRSHFHNLRHIGKLRHAIQRMYDKMPDELKQDPEIQEIQKMGRMQTLHLVRFLYTAPPSELSSKDYEFSRLSIEERKAQGYEHALMALKSKPWLEPVAPDIGVAIHEFSSNPDLCK